MRRPIPTPINARTISTAQPGDVLRDTSTPGLHLRCFDGRKSFYVYFRTREGRERRPKLGDVGVLTLAQARRIARKMLGAVAEGMDPAATATPGRASAATGPTIAELGVRYLREWASRKKSHKEDVRLLERIVYPALGERRVSAVAYEDIARLHSDMSGTPFQANRVLALLSKMCNLAERWKLRPDYSNPCRHVSRYSEKRRKRYLIPAEAQAVAALLEKHKATRPRAVAFLYLLIYTGARPSEISNARPDWVERQGEGAVLHLPDSKTGERAVFLPPQAVAIIDALGKNKKGTLLGIQSPRKLWNEIRAAAGCPDLRIYDLRHHWASIALKAGYSLSQIGALMGHSSPSTTARYAHLVQDKAVEISGVTARLLEASMQPALVNHSSNSESSPSSSGTVAGSEVAAGLA